LSPINLYATIVTAGDPASLHVKGVFNMNRTILLSTTALLFGATAAFAHTDVTPVKTQNGLVLSMTTKMSAPQKVLHPDMFAAYDLGNLNTKYVDGEFTPWEGYIMCGASATGATCNKISFAFPFTSGATVALAKLAGYQIAMEAPSSATCGAGTTPGFNVALYNDAAGLPGTAVAGSSASLTAATAWGTYGPTVNKTLKKVLQLTVNTPYWMVVSPASKTSCTAWDVEDTDYVHSQAAAIGSTAATGWGTSSFTAFVPAFGVVR
jgi:hypothetical protein